MVAQTCNPSFQEAESWGSLWVQGQPGTHSETVAIGEWACFSLQWDPGCFCCFAFKVGRVLKRHSGSTWDSSSEMGRERRISVAHWSDCLAKLRNPGSMKDSTSKSKMEDNGGSSSVLASGLYTCTCTNMCTPTCAYMHIHLYLHITHLYTLKENQNKESTIYLLNYLIFILFHICPYSVFPLKRKVRTGSGGTNL